MANMFNRGFKAVDQEKKRQDEEMSKRSGLFRFFLTKDKEEADITFLTEQPVNFYEHTLKTTVGGKERYDNAPCIGEDCPHCADGDRPSFKSAWLIIDHREVTFKKDGKDKTVQDQLRLLVYGTKIASQLDRKSSKYGLTGRLYTVVRLGKGTSTSYTFEHGDKYDLTEEEIESVMPDNIKEQYDGTMDSLYTIIENQISLLANKNTDDSKEEEEEEIDETIKVADDEPKKSSLLGNRKKSTSSTGIKPKLGRKVVEEKKKPSIKEMLKNKKGK